MTAPVSLMQRFQQAHLEPEILRAHSPDWHCRIGSVRFRGSDHVWIIPAATQRIENVFTTLSMRAVRINEGVTEVTDEGSGP